MSETTTNSNNADIEKPSWGATIGVFFLCWFAGAFCSGIASMVFANANGLAGYSIGGILTLALAIAGAVYYRSTSKIGGAVVIAVIGGCVIGVLSVMIAMSMMR